MTTETPSGLFAGFENVHILLPRLDSQVALMTVTPELHENSDEGGEGRSTDL